MAESYKRKKAEDYGSFTRAEYKDSDFTKQTQTNLNSLQEPGAHQDQWQHGLNDVMNKIMNREKFSYDLNGDALYQQYKDQAALGGQMAMQDTMGQASAMTGGYGNSYAQGVGQQAYQGYLQKLNDKIPELYKLALDQYNREGEDLYNKYGLLADRSDTDYRRYRDTVSDYKDDRSYYGNMYLTSRQQDKSDYFENEKLNYGIFSDRQDLEYRTDSDSADDFKWGQEIDLENKKFDEGVRQFGVKQENWQKEFGQSVKQADRNYELAVRQIEEDERNGKISREKAQKELALAKQGYLIEMANFGLAKRKTDAEIENMQADNNLDRYRLAYENEEFGNMYTTSEAAHTYATNKGVSPEYLPYIMSEKEWYEDGAPLGDYAAYVENQVNYLLKEQAKK